MSIELVKRGLWSCLKLGLRIAVKYCKASHLMGVIKSQNLPENFRMGQHVICELVIAVFNVCDFSSIHRLIYCCNGILSKIPRESKL